MTAIIQHWIERLDMSVFAERLKLPREARNITQTRLAELLTVMRIADILQVSLDELAGRVQPTADLKIRNYELHRLSQECDNLPDEDQQALIVMMDSLVKKANLTKVMGKAATG